MINLRLAEYNLKTGKFKRFLELGEDFLYGHYFIMLDNNNGDFRQYEVADYNDCPTVFNQDEKDPLLRFSGLFDGRTYGEGRFVLMKCGRNTAGKEIWQDDLIEAVYSEYYKTKVEGLQSTYFYFDFSKTIPQILPKSSHEGIFAGDVVSNLHENPELWSVINV